MPKNGHRRCTGREGGFIRFYYYYAYRHACDSFRAPESFRDPARLNLSRISAPSRRCASISLPRDLFLRALRLRCVGDLAIEKVSLSNCLDRGERGTTASVYRLTREFKVPVNGVSKKKKKKKRCRTLWVKVAHDARDVLSRSRERIHLLLRDSLCSANTKFSPRG